MARPMLDEIELQQVQQIDAEGDQVLHQHAVPALEGDFLQRLGRRATRFTLSGVLTGTGAEEDQEPLRERLKDLREKFLAAQPVSFVADLATATQVDQVLIEEMSVRELAGRPERFEYAFTLREYTEAEAPGREIPPPPPPEPATTLIVEVTVEGEPNFDFSTVTVTVRGVQDDGVEMPRRTLTNRVNNVWTEEDFPAGNFTAEAVVTTPAAMSDSATRAVPEGQTTTIPLTLRRGPQPTPGPTVFRIHYWFDRAFIEPCLRPVMRDVAQFATEHPDEKLIIIGHTDKTGNDAYNQSLSERRARAAFALLTFGRDRNGAINEWDALRRTGLGVGTLNDDWGTRETHYMLQDLGFYHGPIDDGSKDFAVSERTAITTETPAAISAFQTSAGLPATGTMNDATWRALIEQYLAQDNLSVPESQFLPNCDPEILKWVGAGEQDPILLTPNAHRPNRRTEFIFVKLERLECEILRPVTFNLPAPGAVNSNWCLGPTNDGDVLQHRKPCFVSRPGGAGSGPVLITQPPDVVNVSGSIRFSDGTPLPNCEYVMLSPVGEFLDGEIAASTDPDRGRPRMGRTDANGQFRYAQPKPEGVYSLEVRGQAPGTGPHVGPFLAMVEGDPPGSAKGAIVCKRLTPNDAVLNVIVFGPAIDCQLTVVSGATLVPGTSEFFALASDAGEVVTFESLFPTNTTAPFGSLTWTGGDPVAGVPARRQLNRSQLGVTNIVSTLSNGSFCSLNVTVSRLQLDVDANRDGVVEALTTGKNSWDFGAGQRGAVILFNNDNDDKPAGSSVIDSENSVVDGANDVPDLAPLVIRQSGGLPAGTDLVLKVSDQSKIRIFDSRSAGATAIIGPSPLPAEFTILTSSAADTELGMEAIQYADSGFDGRITIGLELRQGSTILARDEVMVRVAPWVMPSHLNETTELYVVRIPGFNDTFLAGIRAAASAAGVPLREVTNNDQWIQDSMEIGYSRMPSKADNVVSNAIRTGPDRTLFSVARAELLAPDYGFVGIDQGGSSNTFDSHGNLEVSPPVRVGTRNFRLGRIYFGSGRPTSPFNAEMRRFLNAQLVQKPFNIDTNWLAVGHVDEIVSFIPVSGAATPFKMLIVNTVEAINILRSLSNAGHGGLTVFPGKPEARTVNTLLTQLARTSVGELGWANRLCQTRLDGVRTVMKTELGLRDADIVTIPGLFVESIVSPRPVDPTAAPTFDALIPGMVNMLVITKPTVADSHLVMADPFGPVLNGVDPFKKAVQDKMTAFGYAASHVHFVDDYDSYHIKLGEVHCGTNSKRRPHSQPWWEQTDF